MKNIVHILACFLLMNFYASAQNQETVFDPIVLKAKETSLYSGQLNWEEINATFIELTKDKLTVEEMGEGLQYLINSLGDKHGSFRSINDYSIIVSYQGEIKEQEDHRDTDFVNNVINDISDVFSYELLANDVGYLKVVGIGPGNVKNQADLIRNGLLDLKEKGVEKWIVDLRFNGGGNMEPMISGLAPLLGEGDIGGAINFQNEVTRVYKIENGQFNNYGRIACEMNDLPKINPTEKVVVLTSRYTISSGEMVAVAFKGRDHTRFIGEATAGYTTGNGFDAIDDEVALVISQDVFMDRNNIGYETKVGVDEHIDFQHVVEMKDDLQIRRAIEWLNEKQ